MLIDVSTWTWEEAFDKFGFGDGDGDIMTWTVAKALQDEGYYVEVQPWGLHNTIINVITKDGEHKIPYDNITLGYDNPREYLPKEVIEILDKKFPKNIIDVR